MLIQWLRPLYEPDDPPHGGGDEPPDKPRTTDVLDRYGRDALKLAEKLSEALSDNYTLREQRRELKRKLADVEGKTMPEGATVLTSDDAAAWAAYKALGQVADLQTALTERETLKTEATALRTAETIRTAAEAHGYKAAVLTRLADGLELTIKADGKGEKHAYVVADGKETALDAYAEAEWADFLPSLKQTDKQADRPAPPNINGSNRGAANGKHQITDAEREAITRRYQHTF